MTRIFVGEPLSVSLISGIENFYAYAGIFTIFCRKFFCLTVPKIFIGEPFHVSPKFWYRKFLWVRGEGGNITIFGHNFFSLTVPKVFVGEPFSVSLISGMEKLYAYEVNFTIFYRNFLSYSTEKLCRGTHPCFTKLLVSKSFMDKRGGREYHDFPSKFFCLTVTRIFVGEPLSVSLISGIENFYAYAGIFTIFYKKFVLSQYRKTS